MKEGWYKRSFRAKLPNDIEIAVNATRFLSLDLDEVGGIEYEVELLNGDAELIVLPYLDSGIKNRDSNWDDKFWNTSNITSNGNRAFIEAHTMKTNFATCTFMQAEIALNGEQLPAQPVTKKDGLSIGLSYAKDLKKGDKITLTKFGGYTTSRYHNADVLIQAANDAMDKASTLGFHGLLERQRKAWAEIWEMSDISIEGDVKAQQGIRFNIFQLNQTYLGKDSRLNIGPKGFTGEKYGGSTYWDTEAYCLPFYMATKNQKVAWSLLEYRYNHLEKAIENAALLGFKNGAALYPMVTP